MFNHNLFMFGGENFIIINFLATVCFPAYARALQSLLESCDVV